MPLDRSQFVAWLSARHERKTLAAIGEDLGVSQVTVTLWLQGKRKPSRMALVLAGMLAQRDAGCWPLDGPGNL
jgi:hypothetical protein